MPDHGRKWRIDTLDARGGLAFASWRDDNLLNGKDLKREPPSIFVGAPQFRPEPVVNRMIALSAGRGAFQTGLFIDGVEVSFPTPADVAEFVRRACLSGGGGDGADGGGGETPPPRPDGPPDLPGSPPDSFDEEADEAGWRAQIKEKMVQFKQ